MSSNMSEAPLDGFANNEDKEIWFNIYCKRGAPAYDSAGSTRPLTDCNIKDVEFIGGLWRVQNKFTHPIQVVRGKEMVLMERINRTEKNLFEYWGAKLVGHNCYGRYLSAGRDYDYVVAKYETDNETFWSYGNTIEQARAFLGICLYDKYQDLIHVTACKNKLANRVK